MVSETDLDYEGTLYGGYTQSKWVAERLVLKARALGLPARVYRPGIITGHSQTGARGARATPRQQDAQSCRGFRDTPRCRGSDGYDSGRLRQ